MLSSVNGIISRISKICIWKIKKLTLIINESLDDALFINELVYINIEAKDKEPDLSFVYHKYCRYDYTFTKLAKNLDKEVGE